MILKRDEFLMKVLQLGGESDTEIELNYKNMTIKFNVSGAEYHLTAAGITMDKNSPKNLAAKPQSPEAI